MNKQDVNSTNVITKKETIMAAETKGREQAIVGRNSTARLAGLMCAMLLAMSAVAFAERGEATRESPHANPTGFAGKVYKGKFQTAYGVREMHYQVLRAAQSGLAEDLAIFEGDIVLGAVKNGTVSYSAGRSDTSFRWVNGVVPFEIDGAYSAAEQQMINNALNHWNGNTPYWFRQHNGETDFIRFVRNTNGICQSNVGRLGIGQQNIDLDPLCGTGATIHEIGHAVGLWHEQSRVDRGNFITINFANIQPGMEFNFQTYVQQGEDGRDMFDYDFNSIMHYGSFAFAKRDMFGNPVGPTITRLDGTLINAQRTALSQGDIAGAVRVLTNNHGQATFKLVNVNSGKCLDVANWSRTNQAAVNQFDCHGGANQRWYTWTVPGTSTQLIINDWSGQCLDIPGGSLDNGAQLQQFSCHGFGNQQFSSTFFFSSFAFRFRNSNSSKCLDIPNASTASGVRVQQFTCHTGTNQQWRIVQ
jgi:hypothetical protein